MHKTTRQRYLRGVHHPWPRWLIDGEARVVAADDLPDGRGRSESAVMGCGRVSRGSLYGGSVWTTGNPSVR